MRARGLPVYPPPGRELRVPVHGGRVYVRINGRLDGTVPPLVMIHDGPGGNIAGLLNALALSDERAVIFYDQLDSGRSDHPNNPAYWTVERFADEVDGLRRALGVKRWHVFGHGWGGAIALEYGSRRPPELAGLVLASPLISTRSWVEDANALRRTLSANVRHILERCDPRAPAPIRPPPRPQEAVCERAMAAFDAAFNRREPRTGAELDFLRRGRGVQFNHLLHDTMWGSSEFVPTGTLKGYDGEPLLLKLNGPSTLFIAGQYDRTRAVTLARFAQRVPHAQFVTVAGAAHEFLSDNPENSLDILRSWLWTQDSA